MPVHVSKSEGETLYVPPPRSWLEHPTHVISSNNTNTRLCLMIENDFIEDDVSYVSHGNSIEVSKQRFIDQERSSSEEEEIEVKNEIELLLIDERNENDLNENEDENDYQFEKSLVVPTISQTTKDLFTIMVQKSVYYSRLFYNFQMKQYSRHTDLGSGIGGFPIELLNKEEENHVLLNNLPPFSSLSWKDRQLVKEWRTISHTVSKDEEDEEEFYKSAQRLIPRPRNRCTFQKSLYCKTCHKLFQSVSTGRILLTRHHCRLCSHSFCNDHSSSSHSLPHLGYDSSMPQRVCHDCKELLMQRDLNERLAWKKCRVRDFFSNTLTPYFEVGVDTMEDVLCRLAEYSIKLTRNIPFLCPQATIAVETVEILRKHGLHAFYGILLRQEFLQAADLLCKVMGINEHSWPKLSVHELSAAVFYALAEYRWIRGCDPAYEERIHSIDFKQDSENKETHYLFQHDAADSSDCAPLSDETLSSLLFYAPLALHFIYVPNVIDMQLLAAQQSWIVIYAQIQNLAQDMPANALFIHAFEKIAVLAIRGTTTVQDVVTDIRAIPVPFPDYADNEDDEEQVFIHSGIALQGMVRAAYNLYKENHAIIKHLVMDCGYKIRLIGHSLGGGVSSLLGILLKEDLKDALEQNSDLLHVYGYGTPPCINETLSSQTTSYITSIVLHDDVVPRLAPTSIRKLMKHLLYIRETWVKEHLQEDFQDIANRFLNVWSPRWRSSFVLLKRNKKKKNDYKKSLLEIPWEIDEIKSEEETENLLKGAEQNHKIHKEALNAYFHEGDTFIDALEYNMNAENDLDGFEILDQDLSADRISDVNSDLTSNHELRKDSLQDAVKNQIEADKVVSDVNKQSISNKQEILSIGEDDTSILLEETPLPKMYIPGKVIHIYTHNGGYKASYVPASFSELRQISLASNMLSDHSTQSYYNALLEVKSIRSSTMKLPQWTPYKSSPTCFCCASLFTWASTCTSTAQEARDKHNCYGCGNLVCHPCSSNRIPLTKFGIMVPVRVCDKCYYNVDEFRELQMNGDVIDWRRKNHDLVNDLVQRINSHSSSQVI